MTTSLAIDGGSPVRRTLLPYGRQTIESEDVQAVVEALTSDWLTTGPRVEQFESAFGEVAGHTDAVAVSNGTAALHTAMFGANIGPGDEVIVPAMTFASTANAVVFQGGTPVFADVDHDTLLIDPVDAERRMTNRTRALVAVDYAGQPCDYDRLQALVRARQLTLIADACHALGGDWRGTPVGTLAELTAFSLHPVKHVTTGEGGMVTTADPERARAMRSFRSHGITSDHRQREARGSWFYEMVALGYNYRLTDIQCALGLAQLKRLPAWIARRRAIAAAYDRALADLPGVRPLRVAQGAGHAYHLYVVRLDLARLRMGRARVFAALRAEGIGVNVHYIPVHLHPYYKQHHGTGPGLCPVAEAAYEDILTLPLFPTMSDADAQDVIDALTKVLDAYRA